MTDTTESPQTIEAKEQSLEDRVSALEKAFANLGDAVCPSGGAALKAYHDWRKSIE